MRDQFYTTLIKTRTSHIVHKLNNNKKKKKKGSYLSDKNNLRNQEDGEARRRLAEKVSIATEKHNSNKSLARTSLQVNNRVLLHCFLKRLHLITAFFKIKQNVRK